MASASVASAEAPAAVKTTSGETAAMKPAAAPATMKASERAAAVKSS